MINLTEPCISEVKRLLDQEKKSDWGLRVGVAGGGCSGLSYTLAFDEQPGPKDNVFDFEGLKVYCDPKSYLFLNGMTLDFSTELLTGGFRFVNPNAKKSCSCGTSFSA
ncbi:MAG: iron-sulfur cluster assembly accessory protein [Candidatus Sumerlaeia bacterium]|nr:iron-sulfur cluster assembly accessory protein [Candidatus Sumerlaeia bacterium]